MDSSLWQGLDFGSVHDAFLKKTNTAYARRSKRSKVTDWEDPSSPVMTSPVVTDAETEDNESEYESEYEDETDGTEGANITETQRNWASKTASIFSRVHKSLIKNPVLAAHVPASTTAGCNFSHDTELLWASSHPVYGDTLLMNNHVHRSIPKAQSKASENELAPPTLAGAVWEKISSICTDSKKESRSVAKVIRPDAKLGGFFRRLHNWGIKGHFAKLQGSEITLIRNPKRKNNIYPRVFFLTTVPGGFKDGVTLKPIKN
jgi:hypothetical protein